ncbi:ribulose-phosphate 3-epimerase [Moheibacter lacus]|uniref:Ribulose-phosphate 3-epimerase n=1 Tax=Moheibacter lacus TaxID=2745851 RepID=A0A838ZRJ6_9FLAO|nr:ribulose-phosphate 3-epimerase [Moheibacter lacus]MBA5629252.1 ribulose-phosphate 3-epimerase [Moheibacter lacus]
MPIIAPSVLAADFGNLQRDIEMLNESAAEWIHLDVMDGVFVPNISYGMPIIKTIDDLTEKVLDVHLMIVQPERYISTFKEVGADVLTVHYEASTHLHRTIQAIKNEGMKAGVALNPHTPVHVLEDIIKEIDLLLIMSVNPGFGGQKFIQHTYEKIVQAAELIDKKNAEVLIEVDGGVGPGNAAQLSQLGADVLVAGNAVFSAANPLDVIREMMKN